MKIILNKCYGGARLSVKAQIRYAELMGKEIFFFDYYLLSKKYNPVTIEEALEHNSLFPLAAYTIPNPGEYNFDKRGEDGTYTEANKLHESLSIPSSLDQSIEVRTNPIFIQVIEELGEEASARISKLEIIEVPDDLVNPYIDEYDGIETLREGRTY